MISIIGLDGRIIITFGAVIHTICFWHKRARKVDVVKEMCDELLWPFLRRQETILLQEGVSHFVRIATSAYTYTARIIAGANVTSSLVVLCPAIFAVHLTHH